MCEQVIVTVVAPQCHDGVVGVSELVQSIQHTTDLPCLCERGWMCVRGGGGFVRMTICERERFERCV